MTRSIAFYRDGFRIALVCGLIPVSLAVFAFGAAQAGVRLGLISGGVLLWAVALRFFITGLRAERSEDKS